MGPDSVLFEDRFPTAEFEDKTTEDSFKEVSLGD